MYLTTIIYIYREKFDVGKASRFSSIHLLLHGRTQTPSVSRGGGEVLGEADLSAQLRSPRCL